MQASEDPVAVLWPEYVATNASLRTIIDGLKQTERGTPDALRSGQSHQLIRLLRWAALESSFYRRAGWIEEMIRDIDRRPAEFWDIWGRIPILTKADLRTHGPHIHALNLPRSQTPIARTLTSGSTGIAVEVHTTPMTRALWEALTVREHLWRNRDFSKRLGVIRHRPPGDRDPMGKDVPSWGPPVAQLHKTGPASYIHVGHSIDTLAKWLTRFDPHYLLAYPSVADPLLELVGETSSLRLEEIRFISEPVDRALERRLVDRHGVRVTDVYSANEVGNIAFRCERDSLHVQAETVLVEILDEQCRPCAPGESGRLVVTPLHNFATPLIRYDLGDYAVQGIPCPCGRGLPVIAHVHGRVRNLVRTPDGRRFWPVDFGRMRRVPAIRQTQFEQTSIDTIQVNFVADRALTASERGEAEEGVRAILGYPFNVQLVQLDVIPRGPTGKYEEFVSRLDDFSFSANAMSAATCAIAPPDPTPMRIGRRPSRLHGSDD